jgi:hypothetical protein
MSGAGLMIRDGETVTSVKYAYLGLPGAALRIAPPGAVVGPGGCTKSGHLPDGHTGSVPSGK